MGKLKRKIDQYLIDQKNDKYKMPLIVKGARQIGKTDGYEVNNINPKFIFPKISKNFLKKCSVTIDVKQKVQKKSDSSSIIELSKKKLYERT